MNSSTYIETERRDYALYTLQSRAIPALADGLKSSARRVLWIAKDGKKYKTATLAGATMPLHPHGPPEGAINTLAAPYGNNIPLLDGDGAFGTLLNPTAYGAGRYTSVKVSEFTKNVLFRDIEIVPMIDNYDSTLQEPKHFLPLIPIVLLNPQEGIAVGFASNILPRLFEDIVTSQIQYLKGKKITEHTPHFTPLDLKAFKDEARTESTRWRFEGHFTIKDTSTLIITQLPYGVSHEKFIERLTNLVEEEKIVDFEDESKNRYNIAVKFKRGTLSCYIDDAVKQLGLTHSTTENMTVLDLDGKRVLSTNFVDVIKTFTDWRLNWYIVRYERLAQMLRADISKYLDILLAIKYNIGNVARKTRSRTELKEYLQIIKIINLDYIADLPVYRFTEEEKIKVETKLEEAEKQLKIYDELILSSEKRREVYISELKDILKQH